MKIYSLLVLALASCVNNVFSYNYTFENLLKKDVEVQVITSSVFAPKPKIKIKSGKKEEIKIGGIHFLACLKSIKVDGKKAKKNKLVVEVKRRTDSYKGVLWLVGSVPFNPCKNYKRIYMWRPRDWPIQGKKIIHPTRDLFFKSGWRKKDMNVVVLSEWHPGKIDRIPINCCT